jgi:glutamate/tyrosine decarboxylase-like PLP-dependent enzyme
VKRYHSPGMASSAPRYDVLDRARDLAHAYLREVPARHVGGTATPAALRAALGGPLPEHPHDPTRVIEQLAHDAEPGLAATVGPRYFGFVTGGAMPVTVAADWLASAWDQNGALYVMSPAVAVMEDVVTGWLVDLLGLPRGSSVGFVTGCHMANFTGLAAGRHEVLRRAGWDVEARGLQRAPRVTVIVGGEVHVSAVGALRMLGFGTDELIAADRRQVRAGARAAAPARPTTGSAACRCRRCWRRSRRPASGSAARRARPCPSRRRPTCRC